MEAAGFIARSLELENVTSLSAADTQDLVEGLVEVTGSDVRLASTAMGMYRAHRLAHAARRERGIGGQRCDELLLTVPLLRGIHRTLMRDVRKDGGRFRINPTRPKDRADHFYASRDVVPSLTWALVDVANEAAMRLLGDGSSISVGGDDDGSQDGVDDEGVLSTDEAARLECTVQPPDTRDIDADAIVSVARHAAWFALHFLEVHPFSDGNGRTARVVVDVMMSTVHPLPAPLMPADTALVDTRARWIEALRALPEGADWTFQPAALTELILDALLASWGRLRRQATASMNGGKGPFLGRCVFRVGTSPDVVFRRYHRLAHSMRATLPSTEELRVEAVSLAASAPSGVPPAGPSVPERAFHTAADNVVLPDGRRGGRLGARNVAAAELVSRHRSKAPWCGSCVLGRTPHT